MAKPISFARMGGWARAMALGLIAGATALTCQGQLAAPAPPAHPVTAEQVKQLRQVTHSVDRMSDSIHNMIEQQKKLMPYFPDAFWTDFQAEYAKVDWISLATPIYQKYLSEEDAAKAIAFYSTDAGQRAFNAGMAMAGEMTQVGFEQGKAIGARLAQKYQKEIEENMRKAQQSSGTTAGSK